MGVECVSGLRISTFERVREQELLVFLTVWKRLDCTFFSSRFESWCCGSVHAVEQLNVTSRGGRVQKVPHGYKLIQTSGSPRLTASKYSSWMLSRTLSYFCAVSSSGAILSISFRSRQSCRVRIVKWQSEIF